MPYFIEKKSQARMDRQIQKKANRRAKKKERKSTVPWERAHKDRWDTVSGRSDDRLANRADRKKRSEQSATDKKERMRKRGVESNPKPLSTVDLLKVSKHQAKGRLSPRLRMTTPKAREKEADLYKSHGAPSVSEHLVTVRSLMSLHEDTSELEKRCVADVMSRPSKGPDGKPVKGARNQLSRAFAICRASLQKSGRIKKGTAELTKKGGKISGSKARKGDHAAKVSEFEKDVKAARKK